MTRPFAAFTDDELGDLAAAMDSAAGEGAFGNRELANRLLAEASHRGIATLPFAYGHGEASPESWIDRSHLGG